MPVLRNLLLTCVIAMVSTVSPAKSNQKDQAVLDAAQGQAPLAVETIKALAAIESGSADIAGLTAMAGMIETRLHDLDMETRRYPSSVGGGAESVAGILKGTGTQKVMLMAHMDTVFNEGILQTMPIRQDGKRLYGPGVVDCKGGIAVILHTLQILADMKWNDYDTLTVLFNPDEETGSPGSGDLIAELASTQDTVLSFEIGGRPGMSWVLAGTAAYAQVTMEVQGLASHAGTAPNAGRNAVLEMAHQLIATSNVADAIEGAQLNWTNVVSDKAFNEIPDYAKAIGDGRIMRKGAEKELLEALKTKVGESRLIPDTGVTVSLKIINPAIYPTEKSMDIATLARDIDSEVSERTLYVMRMVAGASGAGYAALTGNSVVLEGFGPSGGGLHSQDEFVEIDSIPLSLYQVTRLLIELGRRNER